LSQILVNIPSLDTPRIQECHMILGHTLCEIVEMQLFPK
jgi:D-sedoheptulose 7-phosphate isomerase